MKRRSSNRSSINERLQDLKQGFGEGSPDSKELRRQAERDLEEISRLGLTERARREFSNRMPGAAVQQWSIGYFTTKETVWCSFRYTVASDPQIRQKEFGFRKTGPDDWDVIWQDAGEPRTPPAGATKRQSTTPKVRQLGKFELTSRTIVITDPGYDEATAKIGSLGCFVSPCMVGEWKIELTLDQTPARPWKMPRTVLAVHTAFPAPLDSAKWRRVASEVGGDSGLIGVCDLAHFHDKTIVPKRQKWSFNGGPANPRDLWYSFVCEAIGKRDAAVFPYGFAISWGGGMDVDTISSSRKIQAIRLSISGWSDRI